MKPFRLALLALLAFAPLRSQPDTVVTRRLALPAGRAVLERQGRAAYGKSYVWTFHAQKGQKIEIRLTSTGERAKFSLNGEKTSLEEAFLVDQWSGPLPNTDDYNIVIVMNEEKSPAVPYRLRVRRMVP